MLLPSTVRNGTSLVRSCEAEVQPQNHQFQGKDVSLGLLVALVVLAVTMIVNIVHSPFSGPEVAFRLPSWTRFKMLT